MIHFAEALVKKSLEKRYLYGNYLKTKGVPAEVSNNLEAFLSLYTSFINNHAKHHDDTEGNVLEFIMY